HHAESNCGTEKRFKCEICKRSYQTSASLSTHKRSHQMGKTELCGFCGASFLNRGQLKIHERVHTGEKPYKCDASKCDKAFGYRESLITHSTIHSGIKPFFCKCCDARFSCVGNLIKHRKLRPKTCGLPEYNPSSRVTPRPTKKTMPSLTDRKKSRMLVNPFKKRLENGSDTRTVSSELASENQCEELLDITASELDTNHSLHADEVVVSEEYHNSEYESEELVDMVTIHDEEDDKRMLLEYIDPNEGQPMDDIFVQKCNEQTSDSETVSFSDDATSNKGMCQSAVTNGTTDSLEISTSYCEKEKEDEELQAQLEIVRTNSVVSTDMFACKLCPLQYTTAYLMARHLERIHNIQLEKAREKLKFAKETVREKRFRCKYCNLSYVNASRLKSHIGKHGADGRLIHKCPACARYFETEEMARQHALEQHRARLVCDICEKQFKEPESLQQHVRYAHKGLKELRKQRYMCHRCGKYFITRNSMSDHERANCGQSPIHRCETCGKHYASFGSLKVHQTMHQNLLPYECEYCRKRFRVKGQLKVHERSHTGERPFRCEHCPKSFPYRESLLVHQVSHTGVKRFACSGCAQTFTCISNLQAHRRYHRATCGAVPNDTKPLQHQ
uniref:C2H2-type domain-containing protein n=1 Tax=Anopheles atroparvus TaxID=41427 RepID=A0A182IPV1_ANOAO